MHDCWPFAASHSWGLLTSSCVSRLSHEHAYVCLKVGGRRERSLWGMATFTRGRAKEYVKICETLIFKLAEVPTYELSKRMWFIHQCMNAAWKVSHSRVKDQTCSGIMFSKGEAQREEQKKEEAERTVMKDSLWQLGNFDGHGRSILMNPLVRYIGWVMHLCLYSRSEIFELIIFW